MWYSKALNNTLICTAYFTQSPGNSLVIILTLNTKGRRVMELKTLHPVGYANSMYLGQHIQDPAHWQSSPGVVRLLHEKLVPSLH